MTNELEAILGGDLVTMVFLHGSAAMLILSMIAATWLCGTSRSRIRARAGHAAFMKVAPRRS